MNNNQKRLDIKVHTKRRLRSDSLGICGNPDCCTLLCDENTNTDIGEIAHIQSRSTQGSGEYDNLILLCPNCHTKADKEKSTNKLKNWKQSQIKNMEKLRDKRFANFYELEMAVKPLLEQNKLLFEKYYLGQIPVLWKKFEHTLLANNKKLLLMLENNIALMQGTSAREDSNHNIVNEFILHVKEFENTRTDDDKVRVVLFPEDINSIFGVAEIKNNSVVSNCSALQNLINSLIKEKRFDELNLISEPPYLKYRSTNGSNEKLNLTDTPRVQQMYWATYSYTPHVTNLRLESVCFFIRWIAKNHLNLEFLDMQDLSYLKINNDTTIKMEYEYCLSENFVRELCPERGLIIVNLHNFNGDGCIGEGVRELGESMGIKVFTSNDFYLFCHNNLK